MDDSRRPQGILQAHFNKQKRAGDTRPTFIGSLTNPGSGKEQELTLWHYQYPHRDTGKPTDYYAGSVKTIYHTGRQRSVKRLGDSPLQFVDEICLRPFQVVLFKNARRMDAPERNRPDLVGAVNFGNGTAACRLAVWFEKTRRGTTTLRGVVMDPAHDPVPDLAHDQEQPTVQFSEDPAPDR